MQSNTNLKKIEDLDLEDICTGCGTCVGLCQMNAISLDKNHLKGNYLPRIDHNKCTHCGICYNCCPGHSVDYIFLNNFCFGSIPSHSLLGQVRECNVAYATNKNIRYNSSSGGLITEILIYALEEGLIDGALVTRMNPDKPLEPEPIIARTREEIIEAARSKYCPVPANVAIKYILENEGRYAVVGLPCHIQGLRKAETINRILKQRILIHLGLFCAGTKTFLATEFLLYKLGINPSTVKRIEYRGRGWPGSMLISSSNRDDAMIIPKSVYYDSFFSSFTPWRCWLCIDHTSELADISFGDAWLPSIMQKDNLGSSIVLTRSEIGRNIIDEMTKKKRIMVTGLNIDDVVRSQDGMMRKRRFSIRKNLSKILGKKTPNFIINSNLPNGSIREWAEEILINCPCILLASDRRTLWFLGVFISAMKMTSKTIQKLKLSFS